MSQIILMSIQPQWLAKILNGEKTIEVRKHALKEGDEVHIYCTKNPPIIGHAYNYPIINFINGKVVAKFIVGKVRQITHDNTSGIYFKALCQDLNEEELLKQSCLRWDELEKYLLSSKNDIIYALEITNLEIFDRPRELGEYNTKQEICVDYDTKYIVFLSITHAPQSWQYAWVEE